VIYAKVERLHCQEKSQPKQTNNKKKYRGRNTDINKHKSKYNKLQAFIMVLDF